jgi:hypothetical protein
LGVWPTYAAVTLEPCRALEHGDKARTIEICYANEVFPLHPITYEDAGAAQPPSDDDGGGAPEAQVDRGARPGEYSTGHQRAPKEIEAEGASGSG